MLTFFFGKERYQQIFTGTKGRQPEINLQINQYQLVPQNSPQYKEGAPNKKPRAWNQQSLNLLTLGSKP